MTGNSLILKPSEQTAYSTAYYVRILRAALTATNHNPNIIQSLPCWPKTAPDLTSHPSIAHLTFIGSRPVAHHVALSASKSLTPLTLELGGKDPAIVLDNLPPGDVARVADILMRATFQAAGQNCIGVERVILTPTHRTALLTTLTRRIRALRLGHDLAEPNIDVGALISASRIPHLEHLVADAVSAGATLLAGGRRFKHPKYPRGAFFTPTLLTDVDPAMAIAREELFAPIMLVIAATSTDHALHIAGSTSYALGASVFGRPGSHDVRRCVAGLRCGMVAVNDFASFYVCNLPFGGARSARGSSGGGGVGGSGYGRFSGPEGLRALCNVKAVSQDRFYGLVKTSIPPRLRYSSPGADDVAEQEKEEGGKGEDRSGKASAFTAGLVRTLYAGGLTGRLRGLSGLVSNM